MSTEAWEHIPSQPPEGSTTYYDRPVVKEPVWIWSVPAYFYVGGAAGAAAVLGALAQIRDDEDLRGLVVRCRWIGATGAAVSGGLLIHDLGRPERFLNMLRVFRASSPMSVGSWVLAGSGSLLGIAAVASGSAGAARKAGNAAGLAAGVLGLPLSAYTAVLLADTSMPAWREARKSLPWLFAATAASGAASLLEATDLSEREHAIVRRLGLWAKVGEFAAAAAVENEAERVVSHYKNGFGATLWAAARALSIAGFGASLLARKRRSKVTPVLGTAAALAYKFAVFFIGKSSARDPRAVLEARADD